VLIGLPSSGLHTNGYTLARAVVFRKAQLAIDDIFPGTKQTVAEVLLAVHRSYLKPVTALMKAVGAAAWRTSRAADSTTTSRACCPRT
jgi:phosphoribosylformylglycinamidine cyclo-ligase